MKRGAAYLTAALTAGLFCVAGAWLEQRPELRPLRDRLRTQAVPAPLLDSGALGSILQRSDLVDDVPNDGRLYPRTKDGPDDDDPLVFRRKSRIGDVLYEASPEVASSFPDSALPVELRTNGDWLILSVAVAPDDLAGFLERFEERIERRAEFSFYQAGELIHRGRSGIKLHGGHSRRPGEQHSYRLHLRQRYGQLAFPQGLLFGGRLDPVRTLVVRRVSGQRFATCFGYDIFRRLGLEVPETQTALLILNGRAEGIYALTEHLGPKQLSSRVGHDDFLVHRRRGSVTGPGTDAHDRLLGWVLDNYDHLTAQEAARYVDLDQLSRYMVGVCFTGTTDWEQGAALLDLTDPAARWSWLPWDLDRGLWGRSGGELGFGIVIDDPRQKRNSVPAVLFRALLANDSSFQRSFARVVADSLNHLLTEDFLGGRAKHYWDLQLSLGLRPNWKARTKFLAGRQRLLMEDLGRRLELGPVITCRVRAQGEPVRLLVDGHGHEGPYQGLYFPGQTVRVELAEGARRRHRGWTVAGQRHPAGPLELVLEADTQVVALFKR